MEGQGPRAGGRAFAESEDKVASLQLERAATQRGGGSDPPAASWDAEDGTPEDADRRARELEPALAESEGKVAALEAAATQRGGGRASSAVSCDAEDETPEDADQVRRQKDEIVKELVLEMERLVREQAGGNLCKDGSSGASMSDVSTASSSGSSSINTSTLERLVSRALSAEKLTASSSKLTPSPAPKKKNKPQYDMYQLSCRNCIGCTHVGAVRKDKIKERVRRDYELVWQVVQLAYGQGAGSEAEIDRHDDRDLPFRASSFSHHVAEHCRDCRTQDEVYEWCLRNVKVEKIMNHPIRE